MRLGAELILVASYILRWFSHLLTLLTGST